jgi:hypothetical protein
MWPRRHSRGLARLTRAVAVAAVLSACSHAAPAEKPAAPPPSRCAYVADHLLSLLTDTARQAPAEELDRVRASFNTRCVEDRWSPEAQQCFEALTSKVDVNRCASLLTEEQVKALEQPPAK